MLQVRLKTGLAGGRWAYLRPLCGHDEALVDSTGLIEATQFLDRLLVATADTTIGSGKASQLTMGDCDRLFAALYLNYFGEEIESTVTCQDCNQPFELRFSLQELMTSLENVAVTKATGPDERGIYTLLDGRQFRLPTADDCQSVRELPPEQALTALLKRCLLEGEPTLHPDLVEAAMEEVGSVLDLDLDAICPHCEAPQTVRFDIQTYVLLVLAFEKRFLQREVHRLALAYGWGYQEILDLPREERRTFVRLIEADQQLWRRER